MKISIDELKEAIGNLPDKPNSKFNIDNMMVIIPPRILHVYDVIKATPKMDDHRELLFSYNYDIQQWELNI